MDEMHFLPLHISELINDTKDMLFEIFKNEGVEMIFKVENNLWITGNRGRLQQVLVNILNNAKDAVAQSEVKKIEINAFKNSSSVQIEISDSGPGVPESLKEKIFDPFFTTKEVNKGTGIGLALVSSIIKEHGGVVSLDHRIKKGARFIITLPAQTPVVAPFSAQNKAPIATTPALAPLRGRVLVVDDEKDLREILQDILESQNLEVFTASNGQEALAYITKNYEGLDLIVSDIKMPIMNGPELARSVRSWGKYQGGFYFITGGVNDSLEDYKQIVDGVLPKPFNMDKIMEIIKKWVKKENS